MAETFAFLFCLFLYIELIILIEENKKKLTVCQRNEKLTKIRYKVCVGERTNETKAKAKLNSSTINFRAS